MSFMQKIMQKTAAELRSDMQVYINFMRHFPGESDRICNVMLALAIDDLGGLAGAW